MVHQTVVLVRFEAGRLKGIQLKRITPCRVDINPRVGGPGMPLQANTGLTGEWPSCQTSSHTRPARMQRAPSIDGSCLALGEFSVSALARGGGGDALSEEMLRYRDRCHCASRCFRHGLRPCRVTFSASLGPLRPWTGLPLRHEWADYAMSLQKARELPENGRPTRALPSGGLSVIFGCRRSRGNPFSSAVFRLYSHVAATSGA
jgi:hypothetical protein